MRILKRESILKRMNYAASRSFAYSDATLKYDMSRIVSDGLPGYRTSICMYSSENGRRLRAWNRGITYRTSENNSVSKITAERYEHVKYFVYALKSVEALHSGIFDDADHLWNLDEAEVSAEYKNTFYFRSV